MRGRVYLAVVATTASLGWVMAGGLRGSLTYYRTPSEIRTEQVSPDERMRLGGLVEPGTLVQTDPITRFTVTDGLAQIRVIDTSPTPPLFAAGRGVIVEGVLRGDGSFEADSVLVQHDDSYRPPATSLPGDG